MTHGVSHRGQDHDITPLDAPCLHMNPVSFGSSALHLKRQFTSNKRENQSLFSPRCGDGVASGVHEAAKHFFRASEVPGFVQNHQGSGCFSRKKKKKHQKMSLFHFGGVVHTPTSPVHGWQHQPCTFQSF